MKNAKAVLSVKFNSTHAANQLLKVCNDDLDAFRAVPGLIQKYYVVEGSSGALSGIYLFETQEHKVAFLGSELASSIAARYGVIPETLRMEEYNMVIILNE